MKRETLQTTVVKTESTVNCRVCSRPIGQEERAVLARSGEEEFGRWHRQCYELAKQQVAEWMKDTYSFEIEFG